MQPTTSLDRYHGRHPSRSPAGFSESFASGDHAGQGHGDAADVVGGLGIGRGVGDGSLGGAFTPGIMAAAAAIDESPSTISSSTGLDS